MILNSGGLRPFLQHNFLVAFIIWNTIYRQCNLADENFQYMSLSNKHIEELRKSNLKINIQIFNSVHSIMKQSHVCKCTYNLHGCQGTKKE